MPNLVLKSERQIQTGMISVLVAQLGLNDINPGSVMDIITQAASQSDFSLYYQIAQVSRLADLDSLTGSDIDLKAFEYGIIRNQAQKTTGTITILRPSGFQKVITTFYAGFPSPIAGDSQINVNNASNALIGSSGTLILGRGTNNEEEVNYTSAPIDNINYFTYVLSSPLTKNHSTEETIILKQGTDEEILAGTIIIVPSTGVSNEIQFATVNDEVLLAGEDQITGVEVIAKTAGAAGNISSVAITGTAAFPSPPFIGARAQNDSKFTTGRDRETDDELRDRIKDAVQALTKGIKQAIKTAIVGLVDPVSAKRVVSASIVLPVNTVDAVKVYIDDGTGFEPSFSSQGFETIKSNSTGGEQRLQLDQFPVVKAQIENNLFEPYDMSSGSLTLMYEVGTFNESISFNLADFRFPSIATAEEVAAAINDKATLIEARTSQIGKKLVITAKVDTNENIKVTGGTSNAILAFPTDRKDTLSLYIDDVKLSKDGATATLDSGNQAPYDLQTVSSFPHTLTLIVDGKSANPQTATINIGDVTDPSAVTAVEIVKVINRDIVGIVAAAINSNTKVRFTSNTLLSASSKIRVTGGSANNSTNGLNFSTTQVAGVNGDYIFNRELGLIQLTNSLGVNQTVTSGSLFTRAKLRAANSELYSPNNSETLVISVDGGADQTITFDNSFAAGRTAQETADFINESLLGATAIARMIGLLNYLEINTNTYDPSGSLEIKSASTSNAAFGFTLDAEVESDAPNKAFRVSGTTGPYALVEGATLVIVIDNDIVNGTYAISFSQVKPVTSASSVSIFSASALSSIFINQDDLKDYFVAFQNGPNTTSGTIISVAPQGGGVARYSFDVAPTNFADYAVNDLAKLTGLADSENNLNAVITAKGADYIEVRNVNAIAASTQSGSGLLSQKRQASAYNNLTGQLTVTAPFSNTPVIGNSLMVIPSTVKNVVDYLNNTKITSLSLKADIDGVMGNTKIQITSKSEGSDGYVQVTGGNANDVFTFSTDIYRGLAGYQYWTGLTKLVHRTIYGDDTNLVSFPGVGAAGIVFRILAPTTKDINVELDVTLREGISIASLENEIRSAVTGYVNNLGVGDDVIIEEIRSAVIQITGVIDVAITEPSTNIAIADNELARVADNDILIG